MHRERRERRSQGGKETALAENLVGRGRCLVWSVVGSRTKELLQIGQHLINHDGEFESPLMCNGFLIVTNRAFLCCYALINHRWR